MKSKDTSKEILLAQQREMNDHYERYRELIDEGKAEEAAIYYRKTLESAERLVDQGKQILARILEKQEERLSKRILLRDDRGTREGERHFIVLAQESDDILN